MPPTSGEIWGQNVLPMEVSIDILLPNFMAITIKVRKDNSLEDIKTEVWMIVRTLPLFDQLQDKSHYVFQSITKDSNIESFFDESRLLCDLRLFRLFLILTINEGDHKYDKFQSELVMIIGPTLQEFTKKTQREEALFRMNMFNYCFDVTNGYADIDNVIRYLFPIRLVEDTMKTGSTSILRIQFWINAGYRILDIDSDFIPFDVMKIVLDKPNRDLTDLKPENYILQVCGADDYLLYDYSLNQYSYIQDCICNNRTPELRLIEKIEFHKRIRSLMENSVQLPSLDFRNERYHKYNNNDRLHGIPSTEYTERQTILIRSGSYVNVQDGKVYVKVGLFYGMDQLGKTACTIETNEPKWEETLVIDGINVCHLPRTTRVAFAVCTSTSQKNKKGNSCIAWANMNLFDFEGKTHKGDVTIHMWPALTGYSNDLNPMGGVEQNYSEGQKTTLIVSFEKMDYHIRYMTNEEFLLASEKSDGRENVTLPENLPELLKLDPVTATELSTDDFAGLWNVRSKIKREYPLALPLLVRSIPWEPREDCDNKPFSFYKLLSEWDSNININVIFLLLSPTCTDIKVREFAVDILKHRKDLELYLLQLVQLLKCEPYLDNALTRLLLKSSLENSHVGQTFFWLLKSEISQNKDCQRRFTLILEAFCRTCGPLLQILKKQTQNVEKLTNIANDYKNFSGNLHDQKSRAIELISTSECSEPLANVRCSVRPEISLQRLQIDRTDVMGSKKRPMKLCWKTIDTNASKHFQLIFKNGDDLRQDMLTLQALKIMDKIWKKHGKNCHMNTYGCLSTNNQCGWIEVIQKSQTVTNIQKKAFLGSVQVNSNVLHEWIKEKNNSDKEYDIAVENFTTSCAAYCVATFILGIGDRHPANIMVTENGMVFHIDFGHFLDHRKKKFGIQRERVPFVLTTDFITVIGRGDKNFRNKNCTEFMLLCCDLYEIIRREANLFLTLFLVMIPSGLPELQSTDDLEYMKKTLAVGKSDKDAISYFIKHLKEAYAGSWNTKINWFFHHIAH